MVREATISPGMMMHHAPMSRSDYDFTPYPFKTTNREIHDSHQLEAELGQDWSIRIVSDVLASGPKNNIQRNYSMETSCLTPQSSVGSRVSMNEFEEDNDVQRKRNMLWKQSAKPSLFLRRPAISASS